MIFGVLAMLGGLLTLLMPETLGARMPEQVEVSDGMSCVLRMRRMAARPACVSGRQLNLHQAALVGPANSL